MSTVTSSGSSSKCLLRGVIDFGNGKPTEEQLKPNWNRLLDSKFVFHNPDERKIYEFIRAYAIENHETPSASLIRDYFDRSNEITVTEKLLDIAAVEVYVRTHYATLLQQLVDEQRTNAYLKLSKECEEILIKGREIGKRKYYGIKDAEEYRSAQLSELESKYGKNQEEEPPAPLDAELAEPDPFPLQVFPARVAQYLTALADNLDVPTDMVAFSALQVLAMCVQRKLNVKITADWIEPCVLWTFVICQSGKKKSPVYKALMRPVFAWTSTQAEERKAKQRALEQELGVEQDRGKEGDKTRMRELQRELAELPARKRVTIQDVTPAKLIRELGALERQGTIPSLCIADPDKNRIADFVGSHNKPDETSILHNGYDGAAIEYDRVGNGTDPSLYLREARVGVFCLTQPKSWDKVIDPRSGYGDGTIGRVIVYTMPPPSRPATEEDADRIGPPIDPLLRDAWDDLIAQLLDDGPAPATMADAAIDVALLDALDNGVSVSGEDEDPEPPKKVIEIDPKLTSSLWWRTVRKRCTLAQNPDNPLHVILKWTSKWEAKMARIAGILWHVRSLCNEAPPSDEEMWQLSACIARHAGNALGMAAAPADETRITIAKQLRGKLLADAQEHGTWTTSLRSIKRAHRGLPIETLRAALEELDAAGHVTLREDPRNRRTVVVTVTRPTARP